METIIVLAVLGLVAYWVYDMSQKKKNTESIEPWPYGEKLSEGKIHVKSSDVAPGKSEADRVETPAPVVEPAPVLTVDGHGDVQEVKPAKKAPAKKTAAKPAAAKKAPAKKKST